MSTTIALFVRILFVLYGYLEAVKANPNYNPPNGHNNGGDWYGVNRAVDDPRGDTLDPNIRVARRRLYRSY